MEKVIQVLIVALGAIVLMLLVATLTGTLIWFLWDSTMVASFALPSLAWWQCVKLSWICGLLFKSSASSSSK